MALLTELKARGLSVTTSEAAELHHRVEPTLHGSAHSQVASAFGGVEPPTLPAGPSPLAAEPVVETGGSPQRGLQRLHASLPVLQRSAPLLLHTWRKTPKSAPSLRSWSLRFWAPLIPKPRVSRSMTHDLTKGWRWPVPTARTRPFPLQAAVSEAQFRTAFSRFTTLCRSTPAAARLDGHDHVLREIEAGISKLMQIPGTDPVAVYYRGRGLLGTDS